MALGKRPVKDVPIKVPTLTHAQRRAMDRINKAMLSAQQNHSQKQLDKVQKMIAALRVPQPYKHLISSELFNARMVVQQYFHPSFLYRTFGPSRPSSTKPQPRRKGKPKRPGRR